MLALGIAACAAPLACAGPAPRSPTAPARQGEGRLAPDDELARLADDALARGDLALARERFERLTATAPQSALGPAGLGAIALEQGDLLAARAHFEAALVIDSASANALVGLARVEQREEHPEEAIALLRRALESAPARPDIHARLARLTGLSPRDDPLLPARALALAEAHPYDPWILVRAAEARLRAGDRDGAHENLQRAVWVADIDPASASLALRQLAALDADWAARQIVPVHVFADDSIRAQAGWRFRMRILWLAISQSLDPFLHVRFVPVSIQAFASGQGPGSLDAIEARFQRATTGDRRPGILAAFTQRPHPAQRTWKQGLAAFLGRSLTVRLEPDEQQSRPLAHEILHLYGAIHVVEDLDSLMNPSGDSMNLDRGSLQILEVMRSRRFDTGDFRQDVLAWIDVPRAIEAYEAALAVNLAYRRMGLREARAAARESRVAGARQARRAQKLDPHLADVLVTLSTLLRHDARPAEALPLLETAAALYGPGTRRGRGAQREADALRAWLVDRYGVGSD